MIERQQLHLFKPSTPIHDQANTTFMDGHHDHEYDHKPMSMAMILMSSKKSIKGVSFSSAFFFFSLFIIFFSLPHVPPSSLFKDTKFWFLLSNAIILVVAADSGAFSSSDKKITKHDVYEEVLINSRAARPPSPTLVNLDSHVHKVGKELALISSTSHDIELPIEEKNNALVLVGDDHFQDVLHEVPISNVSIEKVITVVPSIDDQEKTITSSSTNLCRSHTEKLGTAPMEYLESCEDMSIVPTNDHPEFISLRRSKTENLEKKGPKESEGCDEFSAMSDEELNKRVEEFINKFNREIRLQETKNYLGDQNLENDEEEY